ncbi:ethanolamine kinase 1-like [Cololabis saira]|uniref:ethanolamine kinase 1-like n=1 Tax=Cololabis saira TaxID=129043 RepID=UPI002AD5A08A|nr:ethanolamine kinase 1-like [Cololabis saira]
MDGSGNQLLHLDVQVDERGPRGGILDLLRRLRPHWKAQDIKMKTFTEGITNQLIGCYVGSLQDPGSVLVRLYGRMTELYVDRRRELQMFQLFQAHGCGPAIYCSFRNGICYEFTRGTVLEDELLREPSIYRLIAAELGRIHAIPPEQGRPAEPVLWAKLAQFLGLVRTELGGEPGRQQGSDSPAGLQLPSWETLSSEVESLQRHLSQVDSPTVLCHNDLLTKNIIHHQGTVKFIDYEYADYNYQAFDIGNHFNEFAGVTDVDYSRYPTFDLQRDWLTVYLQSYKTSRGREAVVTETEVERLHVQVCKFSLASNFLWGLWAILQSRYSSIDFDFQRYALARLNYYFEKKEEYLGLEVGPPKP